MINEYMLAALKCAQKAAIDDEVPVGAVIVKDGKIISSAANTRENDGDLFGHAEINAIKAACDVLGGWRLDGCDIYVTLEPCPMCMGALLNARIRRIYFGAYDPKNGACGSVCDLSAERFTHKPEVYAGIMENECSALLSAYFKDKR